MKNKDWFKDRGYPHFSNKTPLSVRKDIERYISLAENVAKHSFYALLFKELIQRRYKYSRFGEMQKRSHKTFKDGKIISNAKKREILYATHIDAHIYSYYTKLISSYYENYLQSRVNISDCISAYRQLRTVCNTKFKNNVHFAMDVFEEIKSRQNCVVLCFDIENFFPSLDHKQLKLIWAKIIGNKTLPKDHYNIFKAITNFSYVKLNDLRIRNNSFDEKQLARLRLKGKSTFFENIKDVLKSDIQIYKNEKKKNDGKMKGIPQGLPISALLANIYMLPFDESIIKDLGENCNIFYRRYSDDIVIICQNEEIETVKNFVQQQIEKINLVISIPKTEITAFRYEDDKIQCYRQLGNKWLKNVPVNYLGFEFYRYQTLLKSKNLASFYREMKDAIKRRHLRAEKIKAKCLNDSSVIFKRKIYRLYSFKGERSRKLPSKRAHFYNGKVKVEKFDRKFRGNYLRYVYRASEEMQAPEIKRQVRNHWKILQKALRKYDFSNITEISPPSSPDRAGILP